MRFVRTIRPVALAIAAALLMAPTTALAVDYSWEEFREDFKYKPISFIVALPAFVATAPIMLIDELIEKVAEDEDA